MDIQVPKRIRWTRSRAHKTADEAPPNRLRRRLRRALLRKGFIASVGAGAAYFLDPQNGADRRQRARMRTNTSAHHLEHGLQGAADVARTAANLTEPSASDSVVGTTGQGATPRVGPD